jgi:xanthine dehydrogenase accessory factor
VTVFDDRAELVTAERFPTAEKLVCGDFSHIAQYLAVGAEDYVVVMTSGHAFDFAVQEQLLRGPAAYFGVIGSRAKTASVNEKLRAAGVDEAAISRVHTPIGTPIKAVTPEEIAISIAGEMIYERALRREKAGVRAHGCPMH